MTDSDELYHRDFACVTFRTPTGLHVQLGPGHMIGRSVAAALRVNEPGVSEAHALVSLRGSAFKIIALRGRFKVGEEIVTSADLTPGLQIGLAPGITVQVVDVMVPATVLGLMGDGLARQILPPVASLLAEPLSLHAQFLEHADALIWWDGERFHPRRPGHEDARVEAGFGFDLGGRRFTFIRVPLDTEAFATTQEGAAHESPLLITLAPDSVRLTRAKGTVVLSGLPAEIVTELATAKPPITWGDVSAHLWPAEDDRVSLRQKWDRALARLRLRLRVAGIHLGLVRSLGDGRVELALEPGDRVIDERW